VHQAEANSIGIERIRIVFEKVYYETSLVSENLARSLERLHLQTRNDMGMRHVTDLYRSEKFAQPHHSQFEGKMV